MKVKAYNNRSRNDWMIFAFGAAAILAGAFAIAKGASYFRGPARIEGTVAGALGQNHREPNEIERYLQAAQESAAALKEKNLFIHKPPRQHPVKQVDGILGDEALIGDKWYQAGAKVGDATIVAVEPTAVRIEWDGEEKTFPPLAAAGNGRPSHGPPPAGGGPAEKPAGPPAKPGSTPATVRVERTPARAPSGRDSLAWMGVDLPPEVKQKLIEHWNNMSPEEQEKARSRWNSMPPEEKERAIDNIRQRL
jgi:hypothetical protein